MTPKTLAKERREKFEAIIRKWIDDNPVCVWRDGSYDILDDQINTLVLALVEASESRTEKNTAYRRGEQEAPDKVEVMLEMETSPAAKKIYRADALLSRWSVAFLVKTTAKDWKAFADYAIDMQDRNGWEPDRFIEWVKKQEGYPTFWSRKRMEENYPKAFVSAEVPQLKTDENGVPETY